MTIQHTCSAHCHGDVHCSPVWTEPISGISDVEVYADLVADQLARALRVRVLEVRPAPELPPADEWQRGTGSPIGVIAGDHVIPDGYRFLIWWRERD